MAGKYRVATLGCKVNQYESQQIRELLDSSGWHPAESGDRADLAIVNTCAVTTSASRKNRQTIRRLARGGQTRVVVIGCGASADADTLRSLPGVEAVWGHDTDVSASLRGFLTHWHQAGNLQSQDCFQKTVEQSQQHPSVLGNDRSIKPTVAQPWQDASTPRTNNQTKTILPPPLPIVKQEDHLLASVSAFAGHQRAFLKVQDGCDAYCSYCIIPQLRSTLRSKPIDVAVTEATKLVEAGYKEIILTGIFLGAYGRDTALRKRWKTGKSPLSELVEAIADVPNLLRLRLSSLEPGDVDDSLLDVIASHQNCVPHLHLPLQAGSPEILRRMNRQYTQEAFLEMIDNVYDRLDHPAITTDIIAGFPGETEEDFQQSIRIARDAQFCKIHAFPFSARDKTAAARWQREFIPAEIVRDRMQRLASVEEECSLAFRKEMIGRIERVLVEEKKDAAMNSQSIHQIAHGRCDRYFTIHFDAASARAGHILDVRIDRVTPTRTHGTLVAADELAQSLPVLVS